MSKVLRAVRVLLQVVPAALVFGPLHGSLTITEIMYHPGPAGEEGRRREFVEVFNTSPEPLDLSGYHFSRGLAYTFPSGSWLGGHSYLVVCADTNYIRTTYSITNTVGPWEATTALDNGGETVAIAEPSGAEMVVVRYNDQGRWPAAADGTGHSLAALSPYLDPGEPESWEASSALGGSPGRANPAPPAKTVLFNEGLIFTAGERWIELYNPGGAAVSLANYYLTDDPQNLTKSRLDAGASVPSRGRLAFSDVELGLSFAPIPNPPDPGPGRTFVALVVPAGNRVADAFTFEPLIAEHSEARFPDGAVDWAPAATPTRGGANQVDVETEVVINEIMYHPMGGDSADEYLELYNRGSSAVSLDGWEFTQGINFLLPPVTLSAGGSLVVARNPDRIRAVYGLTASQVVGPAQDAESLAAFGVLSDAGERLTLVDGRGNVCDTVRWYDGGDWPKWADGLGSSLELIDPFADNSRASAWDASDDSAKAQVEAFSYSGRHVGGSESELHFLLPSRGIAIIDDVEIRAGAATVVVDRTFIEFGQTWRYLKGTAEASAPATAWRGTGFSDSSWSSGATPLGYGEPDIVTPLADMQNGYLTVFCRKTFSVTDRNAVDRLFLEARYDDGFFAWLNGTQVAARNITGSAFNAPAAGAVEPTQERIDITQFKSALVNGNNVLAIQAHNANLPSTDLLIDVRLQSGRLQAGGAGPNLIPNGTFDANDNGWLIEGTHILSGRTTEDVITGAGSLKLIATGGGDNKVNRIEIETSPAMNTTDTYTVSFKARWVIGSRTVLTHDFQNLDTSLARSHSLAVPEDLGSPGAINSVTARQVATHGSADQGPTIAAVSHSPAVPQGGEAVTVRANIEDPDGVASAKVVYYLNSPGLGQAVEPQPVGVFYDHRDVGGPCTAGNTSSTSSTAYTVTGAGADIWQGGDQFQFAYTYATGDFTMSARLATKNWAGGSRWGKAGIMARQSLSSTARYAMVQDHGADLQDPARLAGRPTDGGSDNFEIGIGAAGAHPGWLRLQRAGNVFRAYGSNDGVTWTFMEQMDWGAGAPATVMLGLALTSHADCPTTTIGFTNVTISGTTGGPPATGGGSCTADSCEVSMSDPDGDGVWSATLPGRALGQKVVYSIEAADAGGKLERYPPDVTARTGPLLLEPASTDPADQRYLIYRHDTRDLDPASPFHKYRFLMHDLDEAYLDTRQVQSNDRVEGTFVFGSADIYQRATIRFAGSPWARGKWSSFRINFPDDRPLHGTKYSFNLDTVQGDIMSAKERISNYLFRANSRPWAPVPYAINRKVRFWANSRDIGLRDHVEVPNSQTLSRWWPEDDRGDFFEMDDRFEFNDGGARLNSRDGRLLYPPYNGNPEDQEEYRWYFRLGRDEQGDNYANLIDLAKVLDPGDTTDAQFDGLIDDFINVENFLRNWAVRLNTDDWDMWGSSRGKNCYLYRPPVDGRWYLIPWDMELTYGDPSTFAHPTGSTGGFGFAFSEVNRLLNRPRLRRLYYGILKEMVDGPFRSAYLSPYMTRLETLGFTSTAPGKSGGFVDQRRTRILSWINPVVSPQVSFAITSPNNGNAATVSTATVNLAGNAPVEVFQIEVLNSAVQYEAGDVPPPVFSNSSMTAWSLGGVPLAPGVNTLTLLGLNSQGNVVGQDTIQVTSTASWSPPVITGLDPDTGSPGQAVTITGTGFHAGIQVLFGTVTAPNVVFDEASDPTHVRADVPNLAAGSYQVKVKNIDGNLSGPLTFTVPPPVAKFIRGDANLDQAVDISDSLKVLLHLTAGQSVSCRKALDVTDDGNLTVTDAVQLLLYLFRDGAAPAAPFPQAGTDPTPDGLDCVTGLP